MPAALNLVGQQFGILTVRKLHPELGKSEKRLWECKCQCGTIALVVTSQLTGGITKSCGCLRGQKPHDLTGKHFGNLTALTLLKSKSKFGKLLWRCKCSCGRESTVSANQLTQGRTKSCGCLNQFKKGKVAAAHKATVKVLVGEEWWYSPRLTARILKVDISTLYPRKYRLGWKNSCPWLDGEGLRTTLIESALGRSFEYFHGPTVERAKAAMHAAKPIPAVADHVHIAAACKRMGCSLKTVQRRRLAEGVPVNKQQGKGKDGHKRYRSYVPQWFVEKHAPSHPNGAGPSGVAMDGADSDTRRSAGEQPEREPLPVERYPTDDYISGAADSHYEKQAEAIWRHAPSGIVIPPRGESATEAPRWDNDLKQLWYGSVLCRDYRTRSAPEQWSILKAFEARNWTVRIDSPVDEHKLKDAVRNLNAGLNSDSPIRFKGDGTGKGVIWSRSVEEKPHRCTTDTP